MKWKSWYLFKYELSITQLKLNYEDCDATIIQGKNENLYLKPWCFILAQTPTTEKYETPSATRLATGWEIDTKLLVVYKLWLVFFVFFS